MLLLLMEIKSNLLQWHLLGGGRTKVASKPLWRLSLLKSVQMNLELTVQFRAVQKHPHRLFSLHILREKIDACGLFRNIVCHIFLSCSFAKLQKVFVVLNYKPDRNKTLLLSRNFADIGAPSFVC